MSYDAEEDRVVVAAMLTAQAGPGQRATLRGAWHEAFMACMGAGASTDVAVMSADEAVIVMVSCDMLPGVVFP